MPLYCRLISFITRKRYFQKMKLKSLQLQIYLIAFSSCPADQRSFYLPSGRTYSANLQTFISCLRNSLPSVKLVPFLTFNRLNSLNLLHQQIYLSNTLNSYFVLHYCFSQVFTLVRSDNFALHLRYGPHGSTALNSTIHFGHHWRYDPQRQHLGPLCVSNILITQSLVFNP